MNKSEIYTRDYLLIQFMLDYYCDGPDEAEDVYKDWIWWLKTKEKRDGRTKERSEI